jgi:hypothetical protein
VIAEELREAHDRLIAPHWSRIRAVLDADIAYRAKQLATGGTARLFATLHPDLQWEDGRLTLTDVRRDRAVNLGPGGLVLLPVALGTPQVLIKGNTTTQTTVRYPARGVGALWTAGTRAAPGSAADSTSKQLQTSPTVTSAITRGWRSWYLTPRSLLMNGEGDPLLMRISWRSELTELVVRRIAQPGFVVWGVLAMTFRPR